MEPSNSAHLSDTLPSKQQKKPSPRGTGSKKSAHAFNFEQELDEGEADEALEDEGESSDTDENDKSGDIDDWTEETQVEDPLEILEDPSIAVELSEDPVRLYLKEIGLIDLLDADSEFRLATRIAARRILASVLEGSLDSKRSKMSQHQ
ncbi:MAG: sigma-70 factor domain-containing protein, partial [Anaerolineaceae bacterium]|nr:sigma-70 factor domain-containing protein [Anaerolineaceae bacterium]